MNANKLCNKSNIAAVEGEEYFIQKIYNNHQIHIKNTDKTVGNNISLFLYCL